MPGMSTSLKRFWRYRDRHLVGLRFWITAEQVQRWAAQTQLFFVLGMGRSGTSFLARLLATDAYAHVCHEPVNRDFKAYRRAFHAPDEALHYITRFRSREIYLRAAPLDLPAYGEVNSALRRHAAALNTVFPDAALLHLVRDGRDVVRSMMARRTLRPGDFNTATVGPPPDDPWYAQWPTLDRFARLCWYWQAENAYVRQIVGASVRFEDLLTDYDYFAEHVLAPCGVQVSYDAWRAAVSQPRNQTARHTLADPAAWTPEQSATFWRICGAEMRAHGYEAE